MPHAMETERLILRHWKKADRAAFARMNADPRVMQFMPKRLTAAESDALAGRFQRHIEEEGFGLWAAELKRGREFIGFVGLSRVPFQAPFTPAVEIGWRIAYPHWNRGYATEGAGMALDAAFGRLVLREVVSFTVPDNRPSRRVMEKLGMARDPKDDFAHPNLPPDHPLSRHVLYRVGRADWLARKRA